MLLWLCRSFLFFKKIYLFGRWVEKGDLPSTGTFPKCLQQPSLGHVSFASQIEASQMVYLLLSRLAMWRALCGTTCLLHAIYFTTGLQIRVIRSFPSPQGHLVIPGDISAITACHIVGRGVWTPASSGERQGSLNILYLICNSKCP